MAWEPETSDYLDVLKSQNPWWSSGKVPTEWAKPRRRDLAQYLAPLCLSSELDRFHLIIGPRRVGKTVAMHQTVQQLIDERIDPERIYWMHMAHPLVMRFSLGELVDIAIKTTNATADKPAYIFVDEITYADQWDLWLKTFFDERRPIRLIGTSSSAAALRQGRVESGVGRWEEHYLSPCSFAEYLALAQAAPLQSNKPLPTLYQALSQSNPFKPADHLLDHFKQYLMVGGFPELMLSTDAMAPKQPALFDADEALESEVLKSQRTLSNDAIQKAIYQDIPQVFNVQEPIKLERLLYTLAGQIAEIVSFASLERNVGLSAKTLQNYISYLERSFLLFLLPNYAPSEEAVQRRGRKLYFIDSAVRNAALQRGVAPLSDPAELGHLYENTIAAHLFSLAKQTNVRLYHWRDAKHEVDFVYDHPTHPLALEIATSAKHPTKGLRALCEKHDRFKGKCFLIYPDATPRKPDELSGAPGHFPIAAAVVLVSRQASAALQERLSL